MADPGVLVFRPFEEHLKYQQMLPAACDHQRPSLSSLLFRLDLLRPAGQAGDGEGGVRPPLQPAQRALPECALGEWGQPLQ